MLKKFLNGITSQRAASRQTELYRNLIRHEAKIGGELFGPVAPGGRREFFCLDKHTWVWHEEWINQVGELQSKTTRYDIRPNGVLKSQHGHYQPISPNEAKSLYDAMKLYYQRVTTELYSVAR